MASFLVENNEHISFVLGKQFVQILQQNFVIALTG
jgi:hypothetical protein